eukprot:12056527-Prorocentrum_lima.AAC.1
MARSLLQSSDRSYALLRRSSKPKALSAVQISRLDPFLRNGIFRPRFLRAISIAAARLCGWLCGAVQAHRYYAAGGGHWSGDLLTRDDVEDVHPLRLTAGKRLLPSVVEKAEHRE